MSRQARYSGLELNLLPFASIRLVAATFQIQKIRLSILVNNTNIIMKPESVTEDGHKMRIGTEYLGHVLFTFCCHPYNRLLD